MTSQFAQSAAPFWRATLPPPWPARSEHRARVRGQPDRHDGALSPGDPTPALTVVALTPPLPILAVGSIAAPFRSSGGCSAEWLSQYQ
jgi:hypothetical protein